MILMKRNKAVLLNEIENTDFLIGDVPLELRPLPVYGDEACAFLSDLSRAIMQNQEAKGYPDVISFGYWCRKGNVQKKRDEFLQSRKHSLRVGRGMAFHIAPSNVPVNFAFSYAFGLLAGNANVVRVPSKPFPQVKIILDSLRKTLEDHPAIAARSAFVSYPSSGSATKIFSAHADVRIVWGGDNTIETVRAFLCKPRSKDIVFSDRYSLALINGSELESVTDEQMVLLARRFYNDTYLMDQNACSSPHLVLWENATEATKDRFWGAVRSYAESEYLLQPAIVMDKYVKLCEDVLDGITDGSNVAFDGLVTVVELGSLPGSIEDIRGKGGYFYQIDDIGFDDLASCLTEKTQTLVYFGYDAEKLGKAVVLAGMHGIDRIVPIGSAMDIDVIWDGYDLIGEMSRIIDVS